jgi:hypothetical protein
LDGGNKECIENFGGEPSGKSVIWMKGKNHLIQIAGSQF